MGKVDELIEKLAEHIIGIMGTNDEGQHEVVEKIKALADLVAARAYIN